MKELNIEYIFGVKEIIDKYLKTNIKMIDESRKSERYLAKIKNKVDKSNYGENKREFNHTIRKIIIGEECILFSHTIVNCSICITEGNCLDHKSWENILEANNDSELIEAFHQRGEYFKSLLDNYLMKINYAQLNKKIDDYLEKLTIDDVGEWINSLSDNEKELLKNSFSEKY